MKKLKKERFKFNRDYLKPLLGCLVLFVLLVIFMIILGYSPKEDKVKEKKTSYYLNIDDNSIDVNTSCDTNFYKSVIENVNKIDLGSIVLYLSKKGFSSFKVNTGRCIYKRKISPL